MSVAQFCIPRAVPLPRRASHRGASRLAIAPGSGRARTPWRTLRRERGAACAPAPGSGCAIPATAVPPPATRHRAALRSRLPAGELPEICMKRTYQGSCHCGAVRVRSRHRPRAGHGQVQLLDLHQDAQLERDRSSPTRFACCPGRMRSVNTASAAGRARIFSANTAACVPSRPVTFPRKSVATTCPSSWPASMEWIPPNSSRRPVHYANGRDNKWWEPPAETRHL